MASNSVSTSTPAAAAAGKKADTVKPWHFHRHFARLFAGRSSSSSSSGSGSDRWQVLDGWRGILCLWMVAFHSFFYSGNFVNDEEMQKVGMHPGLLLLNLGFLPVDGFFVLTGFLIAYPLFKEERNVARRIRQQSKEGDQDVATSDKSNSKDASSNDGPWKFDLARFYYRRVTRMLPSYLLAIYFHCGLLFPGPGQHSMDVVRSEGFRGFMRRVLGDIEHVPSHCEPAYLFTNVAWANHLMPFGGCMGWTWSFALQFNFYLFFPLLWRWLHKKANRALAKQREDGQKAGANGSSLTRPLRTPSSYLFPFLHAFLAISVIVRAFSFLQVRQFDLRHEEGVFLGFFWYSNTLTRGAAIVWGVLAARASLDAISAGDDIDVTSDKQHGAVAGLMRSRRIRWSCWIVTLSTILLQTFWSRLFADGNMLETPGWSSMKMTQVLGGSESLSYTTPNILTYLHHALFQIFVLVGSPLSNFSFAFLLLVVLHGIGFVGRMLQRLLSAPGWFTISTLSWWVYLVHPALMIWYYAWRVGSGHELEMTVEGVLKNVGVQWILSFSVATIAYVFVEMPLEITLRRGEESVAAAEKEEKKRKALAQNGNNGSSDASSKPSSSFQRTFFTRLRSVIYIYCVCCMVYIILHHLAIYLAVLSLQPKPYYPGLPIGADPVVNATKTA